MVSLLVSEIGTIKRTRLDQYAVAELLGPHHVAQNNRGRASISASYGISNVETS